MNYFRDKRFYSVCETLNSHLSINKLRSSVTNWRIRDANQANLIQSIMCSNSLGWNKGL